LRGSFSSVFFFSSSSFRLESHRKESIRSATRRKSKPSSGSFASKQKERKKHSRNSHLGELLAVALSIGERPVLRRDQVELRALRDAQRRVGVGEAHLRRRRRLGGRGRRCVGGLGRRRRRRRSSAGRDESMASTMVMITMVLSACVRQRR